MIDFAYAEYIIYLWMFPIVCFPGIITATLSSIVFICMRNTSLDVLLCGLSIFDVLLLSSSLIIYPAMYSCKEDPDPMNSTVCHFFWRSSLSVFPISLISQTGSVWTCVAVTIDRFIAVSFPIKKRVWCTPHTSFNVLLAVTVFSILFKFPAFFEITLNENGQMEQSELRKNESYQKLYQVYAYLLIVMILPWTIIISLNAIIINKVRIAYRMQEWMTQFNTTKGRREEAERRVTVMAIVMTGIFIICNLPPGIHNLLESFAPDAAPHHRLYIPLSNLLVCFNSASNMLIYCVFNRNFRRTVVLLFSSGSLRKRDTTRSCRYRTEQCMTPSRVSSHYLVTSTSDQQIYSTRSPDRTADIYYNQLTDRPPIEEDQEDNGKDKSLQSQQRISITNL